MGSLPVGELLDLVGQIYDCSVGPRLWPAVLERITKLVGGSFAAVSLHDTARNSVTLKTNWNVDPGFERSMANHFAINPLVPSVYFYDVDEPFTGMGFMGDEAYVNSRWYQEAVAPHLMGDAIMSFLAKSGGRFGALSFFRESRGGPFTPDNVATLKLLAPHVRRAAMIADLLETRELERGMLETTLDLLNAGVVLADGDGRIVHANTAARSFIEGSALSTANGQMSARNAQSASELRAAIASAAGGTTSDIPREGFSVLATNPDGRDLAIWVLPLDSGLRRDFGGTFAASVALFMRELGDTSSFPAELFIRRYGITPAECQLLVFLTQGFTLADTASTLGISIATARTHIARLLAKTGTESQIHLMRLAISALAPATSGS